VGANFKYGGLIVIGNQERWQEDLFVAGVAQSGQAFDLVVDSPLIFL